VFKRWAVLFSVAALLAMVGTGAVAQKTATPKAQDNVAKGEAEVKQLLPLMDQDKQGKVSKEEFMKFMAAEFDRLDKKNDGKLDVKELTQPPVQPIKGFHK
jgi:Ca2+-binding EF-hand superfamily protein